MEATNQDINEIQQFLDFIKETTDEVVSHEFAEILIRNYLSITHTVTSEYLYAWFKATGYTTQYYQFCERFIKVMNPKYYKVLPSKNGGLPKGAGHKIIYEINYNGVQMIMLQLDEKSREYFIKCEQLLFAFIRHLNY